MIRRVFGFAALPIFSALASFLILPVIARSAGPSAWTAIAFGQSIGEIAALLIAFGWPLIGPSRVARIDTARSRLRVYVISLYTRVAIFLVVAPIVWFTVVNLISGDQSVTAGLIAIAMSLQGLSPTWYNVAIGKPRLIAQFEILPRIVATMLAAGIVWVTGAVVWYPILLLLATSGGTLIYSWFFLSRSGSFGITPSEVLDELRHCLKSALTTLASGAYASTPIIVVQSLSTQLSTAAFVSADRLYRLGLMSTAALGSAFQGWVSEGNNRRLASRSMVSLWSHAALGITGLILISTMGPFVSSLLFGTELRAESATCFWYGVAFLCVSLNTSTGAHMLVPRGQVGTVLVSTVVGAAVGLPGMIVLASSLGPTGASMGLAAGQIVVCVVQAIGLLITRNRPPSD